MVERDGVMPEPSSVNALRALGRAIRAVRVYYAST